MLATVLLAFSDYYLFTAFFKVSHHINFDIREFDFCLFCILRLLAIFKEKGKERKFIFSGFLTGCDLRPLSWPCLPSRPSLPGKDMFWSVFISTFFL